MTLMWLFLIFMLFILAYSFYNAYSFQLYLHKRKLKKTFVKGFKETVKGIFFESGYFAISHQFVKNDEYKSFSNRTKSLFSKCYNVILFKTDDANWELFFHIVRDGIKYSEIMTIRVFPKHLRIKSEGNVEKNYSRINIFTNNRYLTKILESQTTSDYLKWLIRHNGDILLISHNNLHFKAFLSPKKISEQRVLDMVKALNGIKNAIFRDDVLEY